MVEGARIDKSAHSNDYSAVVREVLDFDKAVEAAIRFAEKDGNTLVIISADHETGALALRDGNIKEGKMKAMFVSKGHTWFHCLHTVHNPSFLAVFRKTAMLVIKFSNYSLNKI